MINSKKIAIIGGGAAGLMCAASLLEHYSTFEIHLFERNPSLGAKVIISGGGRCNVTTGIRDQGLLFSKYTRGADFLQFALSQFPPAKVMEWFEKHGVPLKVEDDLRVFPVSDNGKDVVGAFEKVFQRHKVTLHFNESVKTIIPSDTARFDLVSNKASYQFDSVVLTTGGNAYSQTGSTGDGYHFAKACGHTITRLGPSLNSFLCAEDWPKQLSGLSLEHAGLKTVDHEGRQRSVTGPLLFTHFGISGPVTFALSSNLAFASISKDHPVEVSISADSRRDHSSWEKELQNAANLHGARQIKTLIADYVPLRFAELVLTRAKVIPSKKCAEISRQERMSIVDFLNGKLQVTLLQRRPGDEFVTAGGVCLDEVDPQTMQSRITSHLYFAGEILDIDGLTGGFNLQSSWATGWLAGRNIGKDLEGNM